MTEYTDNDRKIIKDGLQQMVDSMLRMSAERELQKELSKQVKENTPMEPKVFRRMARTMFASSFAQEVQNNEDFEIAFKEIVGVKDDE